MHVGRREYHGSQIMTGTNPIYNFHPTLRVSSVCTLHLRHCGTSKLNLPGIRAAVLQHSPMFTSLDIAAVTMLSFFGIQKQCHSVRSMLEVN